MKSKVKNISEDDIVDDVHTVMEKGKIAKDIFIENLYIVLKIFFFKPCLFLSSLEC